MDEHGVVTEVYGRKITPNLRKGTPSHLYLPGPHRGVFNVEALKASKEVILCESLIDALTFWAAGFRNVTSSYGTAGFTDELLEAFKVNGIERVLIAYDRDDAGNAAAVKLAEKLKGEGLDSFRILFPKGMDANEYALKVQPAAKSLGLVIPESGMDGCRRSTERDDAIGHRRRKPLMMRSPTRYRRQATRDDPPVAASAAPQPPTVASPLPSAPVSPVEFDRGRATRA